MIEISARSILRRVALLLLGFLLIATVAGFAFRNLIHPTFWVDEGLYIGAGRAILAGDILLRTIALDKPFLQAWLPALGIPIAGDQIIGFRLAGYLFYLGAALVWWRVFVAVIGNRLRDQIFALIFTLALFLNPLLLPYAATAMAEPFLLFTLGLLTRFWLIPGDSADRWIAVTFASSLAIKQPPLFWLPLLIFRWQRDKWFERVSWFFKTTWWIWALVILYALTNPRKFAPLELIFKLFREGQIRASFLDSLGFWPIQFVQSTFGLCVVFALIVGLGALVARDLRDDKGKRLFKQIALAALIHFILLLVVRAPQFTRYLVIVLPQFALAAMFALRFLFSDRPLFRGFASLIFIGYASLPVWQKVSMLKPELALGRDLAIIRDELPTGPRSDTFLQVGSHWEFYPYLDPHYTAQGCDADHDCILTARIGRPIAKDHYFAYIKRGKPVEDVEIWRAPFLFETNKNKKCWKAETTTQAIPFPQKTFAAAFFAATRVRGSAEITALEVETPSQILTPPTYLPQAPENQPWRAKGLEQVIKFNLVIQNEKLANHPVETRFLLTTRPGSSDYRGHRQIQLGLRLREASVKGYDLTEILAIVWKGYFVNLGPLDFSEGPLTRIEHVEYSPQKQALNLTITRLRALCEE